MKLLLDSHMLLWLLYQPDRVTEQVRVAVNDALSIHVSTVSLWELALKHAAGKLPHSPDELASGARSLNLEVLNLRADHIGQLKEVQLEHKDPFDQMLIAQSQADHLTLVTADRALLNSGYATLSAR